MLRILAILSFLVLSAPAAPTCAADVAGSVVGQAVYKKNCVTCHGEKLDGMGDAGKYMKPLPRNLLSEPFKKGDSESEIFTTVTNGIKDTGMASFASLPEADRKAVAQYLFSARQKAKGSK